MDLHKLVDKTLIGVRARLLNYADRRILKDQIDKTQVELDVMQKKLDEMTADWRRPIEELEILNTTIKKHAMDLENLTYDDCNRINKQ